MEELAQAVTRPVVEVLCSNLDEINDCLRGFLIFNSLKE
jgi:hypothetical protein